MNEKAVRAMSALKNEWMRCGNWAMVRGNETIVKAIVNDKPIYTRHDGERSIGRFESFEDAARSG